MSALETTFQDLRNKDRKALIPYIMAGDPDLETSARLLTGMAENGADVIELGMAFSDPMADGPVIQNAARRALAHQIRLKDILELIRGFRQNNTRTPIVLMGYFNPLLAYGVEKFCNDAAKAGANGLLIVDIPPEEGSELWPFAKKAGLDIIRMITPTTGPARLETVLAETGGFLYYVSITGITGSGGADPAAIGEHIEEIRKKSDLACVAGFGIKTPEDAKVMGRISDGVVVGSALIKELEENGPEGVTNLVRALRKALDESS